MRLSVVEDYGALCSCTAALIIETVKDKPNCLLGLATGATPMGIYKKLVLACEAGKVSFRDVRTVNLDEYVGLAPGDEQSYRYFMDRQLLGLIDIKRENTHIPNGITDNIALECSRYDSLIGELGGVDLQLLGIGQNGHIGFNEPDMVFHTGTHQVRLTQSTRNANAVYFASPEDVPETAITLGMGGIMRARRILLVASGKQKRAAVRQMLYGEVDPQVPASLLQMHPDVEVLCDFNTNNF